MDIKELRIIIDANEMHLEKQESSIEITELRFTFDVLNVYQKINFFNG
jgi:hypothetical protein